MALNVKGVGSHAFLGQKGRCQIFVAQKLERKIYYVALNFGQLVDGGASIGNRRRGVFFFFVDD